MLITGLAGFESSGGVEDEIEADDDVDQAEYEVEEEEGEGEEEDMARAMEQSRYDAYFGGDHAAGPSAAAPAYAPSEFRPVVNPRLQTDNSQIRWMSRRLWIL